MVVAGKTHVRYSEPQLVAMLDDYDSLANTPEKSDRNVDFAEHLHDGEIRTVDVPILTDQYAPVEQLLNPLTGRPYSIDEQISTQKTFVPWAESGSIVILILGVIVFLWMAQIREIWKGQGKEISLH
jgi:hypothetical protein